MMATNTRIRERRKAAGLTQVEAAERAGYSQSYYNQIETGVRDYNSRVLEALAGAFECSVEDLIAPGEIVPDDNDDQAPSKRVKADTDKVQVPQLDLRFGMGGGAIYDAPVKAEPMSFSRAWMRQITDAPVDKLFWASGIGDSMMPTIHDGDIVLVDTSQTEPRMRDQIWALNLYGQGLIKRLRTTADGYLIVSDNKEVSPENATDGSMDIVGRVVAVVRRL